MITKWNKSQKQLKEFYRLKETKSVLLHSAPHDPDSPRLCCVLQQNGQIDWDTFCLSDFIRSRTYKSIKMFILIFLLLFSKVF